MLTPFGTDVRMQARPWANWAIIAATVLAYLVQPERRSFWLAPPQAPYLALHGFGIGIVTHVFAHANAVHLVFNMIFL
jgi:membrane associated rhomboid family serine protease